MPLERRCFVTFFKAGYELLTKLLNSFRPSRQH